MFRRFKLTSEGLTAAQRAVGIAKMCWPYAVSNLGVQVSNNPHGPPAVAFKILLVDYFIQNIWKPQLSDDDAKHFLDGVYSVFEKPELRMLDRLYDVLDQTTTSMKGSRQQTVLETGIGRWYLECVGITEDNRSNAAYVGFWIVAETRKAVTAALE